MQSEDKSQAWQRLEILAASKEYKQRLEKYLVATTTQVAEFEQICQELYGEMNQGHARLKEYYRLRQELSKKPSSLLGRLFANEFKQVEQKIKCLILEIATKQQKIVHNQIGQRLQSNYQKLEQIQEQYNAIVQNIKALEETSHRALESTM
jgi:hypothetical protein